MRNKESAAPEHRRRSPRHNRQLGNPGASKGGPFEHCQSSKTGVGSRGRSLPLPRAAHQVKTTEHAAQALPIVPNSFLLLHMAFVLKLHTTGVRLIKKYFHTPELLSLPMLNDLDPWRIRLESDNDEEEWEVISPTHSSVRPFLPPASSLSPAIAHSLMQSRRPALHMRARSRVAAGRALHRPDAAAPRHRARGTGLYPLPPAPRGQPHRPRRRGLFSARDRPGPLPRPCRQRRTRRGGGRGEEVAVRRAQKRRVGVRPSRTHGSAARVQKRAK